LRTEVLARDIHSTGFFNNKAKSLVGAAKKILADYGGQVPPHDGGDADYPRRSAQEPRMSCLARLFGIAAGVVVDTHVQRNARRLDLNQERRSGQNRARPGEDYPQGKMDHVPLQLIYHGRALCFARNPRCA